MRTANQRVSALATVSKPASQPALLQRRAANQIAPAPSIVHDVLSSSGQALNDATHAFMESPLGHDFSRIPIGSHPPFGGQPKLTVNRPGDIYEQEADRVAANIMRMTGSRLRPVYASDGRSVERQNPQALREQLQPKRAHLNDSSEISAPLIVHEVLSSPGQPLDSTSREFMETRFGHDFSGVRVYTDARAAESARSVDAVAYTAGRSVVFGQGYYEPSTTQGRHLLAHELAHVLQQQQNLQSGPVSIQRQKLPCCPPQQRKGKKKPPVKKEGPLTSPRFKDYPALQEVLGGTTRGLHDVGDDVRHVKEALIDAGTYNPSMLRRTDRDAESLTTSNTFDRYTRRALRRFQRRAGLEATGILDALTMQTLDERFAPQPQLKDAKWPAKWNMDCMLQILCPWNEPLVKRLNAGEAPVLNVDAIVVTSAKKVADGTWQTETKKAKGLAESDPESRTIYLLKDLSCEEAAITLYHEMWHIDQPLEEGMLDKEVDAEFSDLEWAHDLGLRGAEKYLDDENKNVSHEKVKSKIEELYLNDQPEVPGLWARIKKTGEVSMRPPKKAAKAETGTVVQVKTETTGVKPVEQNEWDCDPNPCRWCWPDFPDLPPLPKINFDFPKRKRRHKKRKSGKGFFARMKYRMTEMCKRSIRGKVDCPVFKD